MREKQRAAVLVPLRIVPGLGPVMTMIRRPDWGSHAGQMAFPGGRFESEHDDSLLDTALRESFEEVGLATDHIEVLGALPDRSTYSTDLVVSAFVAQIPHPYEFSPEEREVDRIIDAPLSCFRDPTRRQPYEWTYQGRPVQVPSVRVAGEVVWGLSLGIIDDFLQSDLSGLF